VRTTLTIDDDVAALLEKENRRAGEPMKQTVNRVLRSGLVYAANPVKPKRFVVKPIKGLGTAEQWARWKDMSSQEILDDLDGEFRP
jgi:hypothetical protein